ncbi:MAG: MmgE/PrpD family protein [Candidatus Methanomethylicia archaeon]
METVENLEIYYQQLMMVLKSHLKSRVAEMRVTEILSKFIVETEFEDIPIDIVNKVKICFLDALGVGIAGFTLEKEMLKPILELIKEIRGSESTVIVDGFKTNFLYAALANGSFIHSIDFDDTHPAALTHTSSVLVPAALALGEKLNSNGKEIVTAFTLGFEAAAKVGQSVMPNLARFWHSTALNGTIGAAALGGKLLKLDVEQMNMAFGIAADIASGTYACIEFGDITKSLHSGMAAMKGLLAAWLVKKGGIGPRDIFEYKKGYCRIYSTNPKIEKISENLGKPFELSFNGIKAFPSILASHTPIQALIKIIRSRSIKVDEIDEISLKTYNLAASSFCNYNPQTLMAARLSIPFCLALAAVEGHVTIQNFTWEKIFDPKIREFMKRIRVEGDSELDKLYPEMFPAEVKVTLKDGRSYSETEYYPKGSYKNPLTNEELQNKFLNLATITFTMKQAQEIINIINVLEKVNKISELTSLLVKTSE